MVKFIFTVHAEKIIKRLPEALRQRILDKLEFLKTHQDIFDVLKKLHSLEPATHRLRIGNYRIILELKEHNKDLIVFWILDIGHRKEIYR